MKRFYRLSQALRAIAVVLPLALSLHGCAEGQIVEDDPVLLMKEAEEEIEGDRYQLAADKLRLVKNKHPYSKQAVDAQLRLGDVYFLQESYGEAAAQYEAFKDLHPKHERVGYAMYRIALSYFNDIPSKHARDLTPASRAQDAFRDYLRQFPKDANVVEATAKLAETRRILAEKEMYIGDFYLRQGDYESAKGRYEKVLSLYSDTSFVEEARTKLAKAESKLKAKSGASQ